jgi:cytochrome c
MKKLFAGVLVCYFMLGSMGAAFSAEKRGTPPEAEALVKKAVAYIKANGKEKAFAEISNPNGKFVNKDMYVTVYDMNGVCLAHGFNQKMIGKNMMDLKDPDGKAMVKEKVDLARSGQEKFWQHYKWPDPVTKTIKNKAMYVEKTGEFLVACGIYE